MRIEKKYLSVPLTAQLEATDFCNHRCIHCYNLDSDLANRPMRKVKDEIVMECAKKLIENGIFSVVISGGEPLIKKELTKNLITLFKENRVQVHLNSNLTLFDDNFIGFLAESQVTVLTSCPSAIPESFKKLTGVDNYDLFVANTKKLVAADVKFSVNMVITKENLHEIRDTAKAMKDLGCKSFAATPMGLNMTYPRLDLLLTIQDVQNVIYDLLWIEENFDMHVDVMEALPKCVFPEKILSERHSFLNRKCQAGRTVISVSCNGDVRPCAHNPISYGNILREDLRDIWAKMNDWRSSKFVPDDCKTCSWLNRCNGGCRTSSKTINGEWNSRDMWASNPLKTPPPLISKPIELLPDSKLAFNNEYLYRQEYDDVFVVYNIQDDMYFMINKAYYDFIVELKELEPMSFTDLRNKYCGNTDNPAFFDTILFLLKEKMLKIVQ